MLPVPLWQGGLAGVAPAVSGHTAPVHAVALVTYRPQGRSAHK